MNPRKRIKIPQAAIDSFIEKARKNDKVETLCYFLAKEDDQDGSLKVDTVLFPEQNATDFSVSDEGNICFDFKLGTF